MEIELWQPVPYEPFNKAYEISSLGRVRPKTISRYSKNRAEVLKALPSPRGYLHVSLYANGRSRTCNIHQMVTLAFVGPKPFSDAQVCHKDDVRTNNRADNLEWGTGKSNAATRQLLRHTGEGETNGLAKLTANDVITIRTRYANGGITQQALAAEYGVNMSNINHIIHRRTWTHL